MNKHSSHTRFTAADALRYHAGQMSEADMHLLEKAALDDPFLADALDGYAHDPKANEQLEALQKALTEKSSTHKKAIAFRTRPYMLFFKIAATLLLLAIPGYFLIRNNKETDPNKWAVEKTPAQVSPSIPLSDTQDTTTLAVNDPANNNIPDPLSKPNVLSKEPRTEAYGQLQENKDRLEDAVTKNEDIQVNDVNKMEEKSKGMKPSAETVQAPVLFSGKVVDQKGQAIPGAVVSNNNNQVNTDASGNFRIPVTDSNQFTSVSALGYRNKDIKNNPGINKNIVLEKEAEANEVVTTATAARKKNAVGATSQTTIEARELNKPSPQSIPANGWKSFQDYIQLNKKQPVNKNLQPQYGAVVLQFKVNEKGRPYKIKVTSTTCKDCEAEAKRLLLNGPDWTYDNGRKTNWSIIF